jgi:transcriptional regulator with PAS, ATPase and Fis domain
LSIKSVSSLPLIKGTERIAKKSMISSALKQTGGSRKKAAELLNISIGNLYYKIERHGISQTIDNIPPPGDR